MPNDPAIPDVRIPAAYVPPFAVAFGGQDDDATFVTSQSPLPVAQVVVTAGAPPLAGSSSSTTTLGPFTPDLGRPIWLTLSGTWTGSVQVKRSVDGGATMHPLTAGGMVWGQFTGNCCEQVAEEAEDGASYYLEFARSSGTLTYRVAQ